MEETQKKIKRTFEFWGYKKLIVNDQIRINSESSEPDHRKVVKKKRKRKILKQKNQY